MHFNSVTVRVVLSFILTLTSASVLCDETASEAAPQIPKQFHYEFANGNSLEIVPGTGVFLKKPGGTEPITGIDNSRIEQFTVNTGFSESQWFKNYKIDSGPSLNIWMRFDPSKASFQLIETGDGLYFVNQLGDVHKLELPKVTFANIDGVATWPFDYFVFEGKWHGIFLLPYADPAMNGSSIVAVFRDDGKALVTEEKLEEPIKYKIEGANLTIGGIAKAFDLKKLDNSVSPWKFPRHPDRTTKAPGDNGEKTTIGDVVDTHFIDYAKDVLNSNVMFDVTDPEEIKDLRRSLIKKQAGSMFITGDSGSGKTELMRAFIKDVKLGKYPEIPKWTEFIGIDHSEVSAGTRFVGTYESRINALIKYAKNSDVILVLDEAHLLRGSGTYQGNSNDFFQMIKPHLADGSIKLIGTTTEEDFNASFAGDLSLARRISKVHKKPISGKQIDEAMVRWSGVMKLAPLSAELRKLIQILSKDYDAVGLDIVKALKLQDEFYAELTIEQIPVEKATRQELEKVASRVYGMNVAYFDPGKRTSLLETVEKGLNKDIVHMDSLKKALNEDTLISLVGTVTPSKPKIRRVFAGPKGLGKTYVATTYAKHLGVPFVRINLGDYAGKLPAALLQQITSALRKNAFTVFLFDEVEKAPIYIQEALLGLADTDHIVVQETIDGQIGGAKSFVRVQTSNSSMFFATNAGNQKILNNKDLAPEDLAKAMVADGFSEFLLDRTAEIHVFRPPETKEEFKAVVVAQLNEKLAEQEARKEIKINVKNREEFLESLVTKYFTPTASYRAVIAEIDRVVALAVAGELKSGNPVQKCTLSLVSVSQPFSSGRSGRIGF